MTKNNPFTLLEMFAAAWKKDGTVGNLMLLSNPERLYLDPDDPKEDTHALDYSFRLELPIKTRSSENTVTYLFIETGHWEELELLESMPRDKNLMGKLSRNENIKEPQLHDLLKRHFKLNDKIERQVIVTSIFNLVGYLGMCNLFADNYGGEAGDEFLALICTDTAGRGETSILRLQLREEELA